MEYSPPHWNPETARIASLFPSQGIFLTGIESSDPQIDGMRRDQLREAHDFYSHYKDRLRKIKDLGITYLRFGMPYSQVHIEQTAFDFSFVDQVLHECQLLGIEVMADLLHFGLPDWMHEDNAEFPFFQNPKFPQYFADYAEAFARRYPHIRYYTIVNEPFVTAYLSAKLGLWNERKASSWDDDQEFVRAAVNIARAALMGRLAIEKVWQEEGRTSELLFVQNESFERAYAAPGSGREREAEVFNLRRFAVLDLIFGYKELRMGEYLLRNGLSYDLYDWFLEKGTTSKTILGIDHYPWCIHTYHADRTVDHSVQEAYELGSVIEEYWARYPLPLIHTEVNGWPDHSITLCKSTYDTLNELRAKGYPVLGMGWYGDELQVGWHVAMHGPRSFEETPVGLYYKGELQPVGNLYQALAAKGFTNPLPTYISFSNVPEYGMVKTVYD